jgi:replicative DNA helicase
MNMDIQQNSQPSSMAEQSIIGCVLIDNNTLAVAREIVKPQDFFSVCNQLIFSSMCNSEDKGNPITLASILFDVGNEQTFIETGGVSYLTECSSQLPSAANIVSYAKMVRAESIKRRLSLFGESLKDIKDVSYDDIDSEVSKLGDQLLSLASDSKVSPWSNMETAMQSSIEQLSNISTSGVIPSGYIDLDLKITGFRPGALTVIAARPAMGKTAFGLNILVNSALYQDIPVAFFSLEMTKEELVNRIFSSVGSINGNAIRQQKMTDEEWNRLFEVVENYRKAKIFIDETPALDISVLKERARRLHRQYDIKMIIVDYMQLMRSTNKRAFNREQEVADISRGLKGIAKELNIPVIALSQLNRALDSRADKRPILSDLRESGSIEQDADNILFIHRDDYYNPNSEQTHEAEIIIAKQRSGPTGIVKLHWDGEFTRFSNLEHKDDTF